MERNFIPAPINRQMDKLKDEAASRAGIRLIRFTGSEIHRDIDACVRCAMSAIINAAVQ
jgi:hypothetical protein